MGAIQPAANAALLTFGCCQAINEGIFCSVSTTVGRCVKSLTLTSRGHLGESLEWWGESLRRVYVRAVH